MCLLESSYFMGIISVLPPISIVPCLRCPCVHSPRHGNRGIGISITQFITARRSHEWINPFYQVSWFIHLLCGNEKWKQVQKEVNSPCHGTTVW